MLQRHLSWFLLSLLILVLACPVCYSLPPIHAVTATPSSRYEQSLASYCPRGGATAAVPAGMNPLVLASPLVVAAVCGDGIAILAIHTNIKVEGTEDDDSVLHDLPIDFSGPFRIHSLDRHGTTMMTAGWRADANYFLAKLRDIYRDERLDNTVPSSIVATQGSLLLATAAVGSDVSVIKQFSQW